MLGILHEAKVRDILIVQEVQSNGGEAIELYHQDARSDGGGEFTSREFNRFCEEEGINRQVTLPYSPQQNGAAERMNRTLVEMARSMLAEQDLPLKLWAEAVYTASYLQNRLPSKAIEEDVTPI